MISSRRRSKSSNCSLNILRCLVLLLATATTSVVNAGSGEQCGTGNTDYTVLMKSTGSPDHEFSSTICFEDESVGCISQSNTTDEQGYGLLHAWRDCPSPDDGIESITIQNDGIDPLRIHFFEVRNNVTANGTTLALHDVLYQTCFEEPTCGTLEAGTYNETLCVYNNNVGTTNGDRTYEYITLKEGTYLLFELDTKSELVFQEGDTIPEGVHANQTCGDITAVSRRRKRQRQRSLLLRTGVIGWEEELED